MECLGNYLRWDAQKYCCFSNFLPDVSFDLCLAARGSPGKKGAVIFRSVCLLALKVAFKLGT